MNIEVIILSIIQGITEFLPVSSSAHLILARELLNIGAYIQGDLEIAFDIALHFGTLLAIIIVFFNEGISIIKNGFKKVRTNGDNLLWYLVVASIPAAFVGLLLSKLITNLRSNLIVIALGLMVMGVIIYVVDKNQKQDKNLSDLTFKKSFIIGLFQSLALVPGFSRSGSTITGARLFNINREDSVKFSFYLSVPVVLGATLLQVLEPNTLTLIMNDINIFITGIIFSFIFGLLTIKLLLQYIKTNDFKIFAYYRLILGIIVILKVLVFK